MLVGLEQIAVMELFHIFYCSLAVLNYSLLRLSVSCWWHREECPAEIPPVL